jgi:hypothetical protein
MGRGKGQKESTRRRRSPSPNSYAAIRRDARQHFFETTDKLQKGLLEADYALLHAEGQTYSQVESEMAPTATSPSKFHLGGVFSPFYKIKGFFMRILSYLNIIVTNLVRLEEKVNNINQPPTQPKATPKRKESRKESNRMHDELDNPTSRLTNVIIPILDNLTALNMEMSRIQVILLRKVERLQQFMNIDTSPCRINPNCLDKKRICKLKHSHMYPKGVYYPTRNQLPFIPVINPEDEQRMLVKRQIKRLQSNHTFFKFLHCFELHTEHSIHTSEAEQTELIESKDLSAKLFRSAYHELSVNDRLHEPYYFSDNDSDYVDADGMPHLMDQETGMNHSNCAPGHCEFCYPGEMTDEMYDDMIDQVNDDATDQDIAERHEAMTYEYLKDNGREHASQTDSPIHETMNGPMIEHATRCDICDYVLPHSKSAYKDCCHERDDLDQMKSHFEPRSFVHRSNSTPTNLSLLVGRNEVVISYLPTGEKVLFSPDYEEALWTIDPIPKLTLEQDKLIYQGLYLYTWNADWYLAYEKECQRRQLSLSQIRQFAKEFCGLSKFLGDDE